MKKSQLILRCAVFAMIGGVSIASAGAEGPAVESRALSDQHTLSEWGREIVLPEMSSSADARSRFADEDAQPDFGEFLSEEINSFGAGATDSEQLRKMMANRAIGREDDSVMSWMSSRWKSAPNRFAGFLTDYAEARLGAMPGVESADIDWAPDDEGFGAFSASGVGALRPSASQAFGFQPKIERRRSDGRLLGSFGVFHRRALGDSAVAGLNIFTEHMDDPDRGSFSRWWLGADFASRWVDADVKRYISGDGREIWRDNRRFRAYTPDGLSAELRVHSPDLRWLEGYAKFSEWNGRGGNADTRTKSFGLTFQPSFGALAGLRTDAELAGDDVNFELKYAWTFGQGAALPQNADPFSVYSDIAKSVSAGENFDIHQYELYEVAHLYESADRLSSVSISEEEIFRRVSLSWELVPEYLRISEHLRPYCPPPRISSLYDESPTFERHTGYGIMDPLGACNTFNGGHTGPLGPWWGAFYGGYMMFHAAAHHVYVDTVKLIIIANSERQWTWLTNSNGYFGAGYFRDDNVSTPSITPLEGVAVRYKHTMPSLPESDPIFANLLTIAILLRANGASDCRAGKVDLNDPIIRAVCNIEVPDGHEAFTSLPVPEGDLLPTESRSGNDDIVAYVAQGYSGEVFRITATTDYADVEYSMSQTGQNFSLTVDGEYIMYYDPYGRGYRETKQDTSGDTRIAIVHMTDQSAPAANYALTVEADFFYHRNDHNNVTTAYTVAVLAHSSQTFRWGDAFSGKVATLGVDEVDDETFAWTGGSSLLTVHENGDIHIVGELAGPATVTLLANAVSPGGKMRGTLQFTVEAEIYRSPTVTISAEDAARTIPMVFATDAFTGAAFTMTLATQIDSAAFSVSAGDAFRVRGDGAAGIVDIASNLAAASLHVGTLRAELRKAKHHPAALTVAFTVSALAARIDHPTVIVEDGHTGELDFEYPPVPQLTFSVTESNENLALKNGIRIDLLNEWWPSEGATIRMSGTSPNMRGNLDILYKALNPDLDDKRGLPDNCVLLGDLNSRYDNSLRLAVARRNQSSACAAIRNGANVNSTRPFRPLRFAIQSGSLPMLRILLANGASVDYETPNQGGPMHQAARVANAKFGHYMARHHPPSLDEKYRGDAPIHLFALREKLDTRGEQEDFARRVLVERGADLNALGKEGLAYLHLVVLGANDAAFDIIYGAEGMDPNTKSSSATNGRVALAYAVEHDNLDMISKLMENENLDLDAKEDAGDTAIYYARDNVIFDWLFLSGADIRATNNNGYTVLDSLAFLYDEDESEDEKRVIRDMAFWVRINQVKCAVLTEDVYPLCAGEI